jgi:DNA polymerase-3 subunit gamma/tau
MTYLVLARKWRPRSFDTLIGQDHVVRALTHALSTQRLHHAWLFTGTRGVGKTTLSRILAKSLNCEGGITATPCGVCRACVEIDGGRFVDYVELDAASNRGVDEMTQLLEQAVYAPSSGRFKVYMIDEVHMLSGHAFNAMLKTLEEPPPHVKFILATTDPQKIPVTVLSRCLQFNLKQMTPQAIVEHLQGVLGQEDIAYEIPALRLLAQAASGSMRDALSLTDQAIAYSAANLTAEAVQGMLGTIDQHRLVDLLKALAAGDATQVVRLADDLASRGLSYSGALADLAILLSRIAIEQRIAGAAQGDDPLSDDIAQLAGLLHPDQVQLFYSVAVHSRHELSLAPDEYAGFIMACLRMLALAPAQDVPQQGGPAPSGSGVQHAERDTAAQPLHAERPVPDTVETGGSVAAQPIPEVSAAVAAPVPAPVSAPVPVSVPVPVSAPAQKPSAEEHEIPAWEDAPDSTFESLAVESPPDTAEKGGDAIEATRFDEQAAPSDASHFEAANFEAAGFDDEHNFESIESVDPEYDSADFSSVQEAASLAVPVFSPTGKKTRAPKLRNMKASAWPALAASLPLTGLAAELARQSEWVGADGDCVQLRVAIRTLAESPGKARLCTVLSEHFGAVVQLDVEYGSTGDETAHAVEQAQKAARQKKAEQAVEADPFVQALAQEFDARVIPGSIRPPAAASNAPHSAA